MKLLQRSSLGKITILILYNPKKRCKNMPQEVGSKTKMAKHLFYNYLRVVKNAKAPNELDKKKKLPKNNEMRLISWRWMTTSKSKLIDKETMNQRMYLISR
ncbi:Protein CBG08939 [Caenorhabditis briggsae]|uniref:Protein CBG08939 n=2 Tax=Caenorhabditis briggsae TaxID=6238 RepID=A8X7Q8_CAEBR|nr:Protein CBG08939 [Caenorhabditis briggsae]ULT85200.1 hypothetical protein L3Y34_013745 [Caenorhabditis briggsae]CAP28669.2 Protein CBG08939 [Caenorhabditis briggsae]